MTYFLVKFIFKIFHWKIQGSFPHHLKKGIIIFAPHTSNLDFFLGLILRKILHLEQVKFLAKDSLFFFPLNLFLRAIGGIPVKRDKSFNMVTDIAYKIKTNENFMLVLSPEGTRKEVKFLKTGFYNIAQLASVPIIMIGVDYPSKTIQINPPFYLSKNQEEDWKKIIEFFRPFIGKIYQEKNWQIPAKRYKEM